MHLHRSYLTIELVSLARKGFVFSKGKVLMEVDFPRAVDDINLIQRIKFNSVTFNFISL